MDSLAQILDRHVDVKDKASLEQLAQEIQYVVNFTKRRTERTMAEHQRSRMNLSQAEHNLSLVKKAIEKIQ